MDKSYYRIFFKVQQKHWWFVVKKNHLRYDTQVCALKNGIQNT